MDKQGNCMAVYRATDVAIQLHNLAQAPLFGPTLSDPNPEEAF